MPQTLLKAVSRSQPLVHTFHLRSLTDLLGQPSIPARPVGPKYPIRDHKDRASLPPKWRLSATSPSTLTACPISSSRK
jgi:hypothetical protein